MTTVLVAGAGEVGIRTARQLLDTEAVDRVLVGSRRLARAREVCAALHDGAEPVELGPGVIPESVDSVAAAVPGSAVEGLARAAIAAGVPFAAAADHESATSALCGLDAAARAAGVPVIAGCGLAPGLSDVLAVHAAAALDRVDEVHVARFGIAGPASLATARRALEEPALEWRDGALVHDKHAGPELDWFPEPVGGRECRPVSSGVELLVATLPGLRDATSRLGLPSLRRFPPTRRDPGAALGAVRVEVWGWDDGTRAPLVYGALEQTAIAVGTVLGVTTAWLAGALPALGDRPHPGATGLGRVVTPVPFLAELARRGLKAAVFEGAPVG